LIVAIYHTVHLDLRPTPMTVRDKNTGNTGRVERHQRSLNKPPVVPEAGE